MKTQAILRQDAITFCAFAGRCGFKKLTTKKNEHQPKARYAICTWGGHCNQQIDHLEAVLSRLLP